MEVIRLGAGEDACNRSEPISESPKCSPYRLRSRQHVRNRVDKDWQRLIERDNRLNSQKLTDIKREAPATYHAPNGYASLRNGKSLRKQRSERLPGGAKSESLMTGTVTHVDVARWPPGVPIASTAEKRRLAFDARVQEGNRLLGGLVRQTLKGRPDFKSYAHASHAPGLRLDLTHVYPARAHMYDGDASRGSAKSAHSSRPKTAHVGRPHDETARHGVPKTLGVVSCMGCAVKSFFRADGVRMRPCQHCQQVYYCSDLCAELDWPHHLSACRRSASGVQGPRATRSSESLWVSSVRLAATRRELHRLRRQHPRAEFDDLPDLCVLRARILGAVAASLNERALLDEVQGAVERNASHGMDGPRPCTYFGGKPVAGTLLLQDKPPSSRIAWDTVPSKP